MRKRLSFARRATADLDEIWDYSEQNWGREQAIRYTTEIIARCGELVEGKIVPQEIELKSGRYFRIRSGSHFIFISEMPDQLQIIRILHQKRDIEAALG
ncbi:MAG TPA: type II toxin-antitoxin system RelE/ParE family toxin [Allosphingosinicella sp.]